jgi:hypothetical protein
VGASDGHVLLEKLKPFAPVAVVVINRVELLFVVVSFIGDIENGIHELST